MGKDTEDLVFGSRGTVDDVVQGEMDLFVDGGTGGVCYAWHGAQDEVDHFHTVDMKDEIEKPGS